MSQEIPGTCLRRSCSAYRRETTHLYRFWGVRVKDAAVLRAGVYLARPAGSWLETGGRVLAAVLGSVSQARRRDPDPVLKECLGGIYV